MEWSYYGRLTGSKPTRGVVYFMVDEYIKKMIDKQSKAFNKELSTVLTEFRKECLAEMKTLRGKISTLEDKVDMLKKTKQEVTVTEPQAA